MAYRRMRMLANVPVIGKEKEGMKRKRRDAWERKRRDE